MNLSRRNLLLAAAATATGSCGTQPQPAAENATDRPQPRQTDAEFNIGIEITGGYALAFSSKGASIGSIGKVEGCHMDHPMHVRVAEGNIKDVSLEKKEDHYVIPAGVGLFTEGVPRERYVRRSKDSQVENRETPPDDWDDFAWIPNLKKAHKEWPLRLSRRIVLPGGPAASPGILSVKEPKNEYARKGVWAFQSRKRPISDLIRLQSKGKGDTLVLTVFPGDKGDPQLLVIAPTDGKVELVIVHDPKAKPWKISYNDPLPHFGMYYFAAEDMNNEDCDKREVPKFASRLTTAETSKPTASSSPTPADPFTPGDFCPPFQISE
jgi:hypothetical protein